MKRNGKLMLCLLLAAALLTACAPKPSPEDFPDITQAIGPTATPTAVAVTPPEVDSNGENIPEAANGQSIFESNPYDIDLSGMTEADILGEENAADPNDTGLTAYAPNATYYPYAGSTPIPLDPIDMPTPTPRPKLSFTYVDYTASTVGVTFKGPSGWETDESQSGVMVLTEPAVQVKDGQAGVVTLSAEPLSSSYTQRELESHVSQRLDSLYSADYTSWKPSYTATRHMMGSQGVYANYTATMANGVKIGGRIQYVCIDKVLYGLEIVYPQGFKDDYLDVFGQIRTTMKKK